MVGRSAEEFVDPARTGSGSAPVDYSAVSAPADSVAPRADAHSVRAAQLADLAQADSLAVSTPAGSAALTADNVAEQDWSLPDARSTQNPRPVRGNLGSSGFWLLLSGSSAAVGLLGVGYRKRPNSCESGLKRS